MIRKRFWALMVAGILFALAFPSIAQNRTKPEILVVYWGSKDCRWCTYWESSMSGMQKSLMESPEFKKIAYRVVKNERLADPYRPEHFAKDILWVRERIEQGVEKRPGRPSWIVYVDKKRIAAFYGTRDWDEKHLPGIKRIVAQYSGD